MSTPADYRTTTPAAKTGAVTPPRVGLLVMGRKRAGFDPQWGAHMLDRIRAVVADLPWAVETPSNNIADETALRTAVEACRSAGVTTLLLVQPTISDGRLAPMLARMWSGPFVLWATPEKPEGPMISANSLVGSHVMAATLRQLGHPLELVYGHPDDQETQSALVRGIQAAASAGALAGAKLGLIGSHAPGFIDFHADPQFLAEALGSHLYHMSVNDLVTLVRGYEEGDVSDALAHVEEAAQGLEAGEVDRSGLPGGSTVAAAPEGSAYRTQFTDPRTRREALTMQARYYQAFRDLFSSERFDALAFRCWPDLPSIVGHWPYLALAMLVDEGFPIAMEGDVDGAICSRIAESAGVGPVYLSDWLEHDESTIAIWHTGASPLSLTDHGRLGVQFNNRLPTVVDGTIRPGLEATVFRIWRMEGRYHMTALEGRTEEPRRDLFATNGLFSTQMVDVRTWFDRMVQRGMPHHLAMVEGRHRELLRRVARMSGMEWENV